MSARGICPACGRRFALTQSGRVRHHFLDHFLGRRGRRRTSPCRGGGAAPLLLPPPPPPPPPPTHGRLPISGGRTFCYQLYGQLTPDDVRVISTALSLAHVDGHAEKAWVEAVAAGLVADMEPRS